MSAYKHNFDAVDSAFGAVEVLRKKNLGHFHLWVLVTIAKHINLKTGVTWLAYDTIAAEAMVSRDTVIRAVKALINAGLIQQGKRKHSSGANIYRLTLPAQIDAPDADESRCQLLFEENKELLPATPGVAASYPPSSCQLPRSSHQLLQELLPATRKKDKKDDEERREHTPSTDSRLPAGGGLTGLETPLHFVQETAKATATATATAKTKPVPGSAGVNTQSAHPPASAPIAFGDTSPDRLAQHLWQKLRCQPRLREAAATEWPAALSPLLNDWSEADILTSITWAIESAIKWPAALYNQPNPARFFVAKSDQIIPTALGEATAAKNTAKAAAGPAAGPAASPAAAPSYGLPDRDSEPEAWAAREAEWDRWEAAQRQLQR